MDDKQFKALMNELTMVRNLLILTTSKAGANSKEIANALDTSDSFVRKILTGFGGSKKQRVSKTKKE